MPHSLDPDLVAPIVDLMYESMLDRDAWPEILGRVSTVTGASSAALIARPPINRDGFWVPYEIDPASIQVYERYYQRINPWRLAMPACEPGHLVVARGEDLVDDELLLGSECYNDFLRQHKHRWTRAVMVRPEVPRAPAYSVCVFRGPDETPFERNGTVELLADLGRHLLRIERLGAALAFWHGGQPIDEATAAFVLTAQGRLTACNASADAMIVRGLASVGTRSLAFASQRVALWLHGLLASPRDPARDLSRDLAARTLVGETLAPGERFDFEILPLNPNCAAPTLRTARWVLLVRSSRGAHGVDATTRVLVERFRWTASEADTVRRLAAGERLPEIAKARGSSVETVRSHLKSAKRKAGVNRQMDLVRIVLETARGARGSAG